MIPAIVCAEYNIQNHTPYHPASSFSVNGQPLLSQPGLSAPAMDRYSLEHRPAPKMGESYTKSDALMQVWEDAHIIDLNDPNAKAGLCMAPTETDLARLAQQMETCGLDGQIDFSKVSGEFSKLFSSVHAGNLGDAIDYLASRAAAMEGQINRNFTGEALERQSQQLKQLIQQGQNGLIDSYANRLQSALGLSDSDTQTIRAAMENLISQRVQDYRAAQAQMPDTLTGTKDEWLLNQNQYMASQLREAVGTISDSSSGGGLTLGDLRAAGEIAGAYQAVYQSSGGDEASLALDLSMIDMKTETLIQKGLVSGTMAGMLQGSLEQRHQTAIAVTNQRFAVRRENALSGQGPIPNLDSKLFQSIYNTVLGSFHQNGGDALAAIRDGVTFGKTATAQAGKNHPKVSRWGVSMADYWDRFYTSSKVSDWYGGTRTQKSEYQKYADSWQNFSASSGIDNIPSCSQHFLLDITG